MAEVDLPGVITALRIGKSLFMATRHGDVAGELLEEFGPPTKEIIAGAALPLAASEAVRRPSPAKIFAMCLLRRISDG